LPADLLKKAKAVAASQEKSLSRLMTESLQEIIVSSTGYREAMDRQLRLMKKGLALGLKDRRIVSRDELHERG
jgi:hypothetical protein